MNLERQQKPITSRKVVGGVDNDVGRGGEGNGGRSDSEEDTEEDDDDDDDVTAPPIEGGSESGSIRSCVLKTNEETSYSKEPTTRPSTRT